MDTWEKFSGLIFPQTGDMPVKNWTETCDPAFPTYEKIGGEGVDLNHDDDARVVDVLKLVNAPNVSLAVVLREGNILKKDEKLFDGNKIVVLETMTGG